MDKVTATSQLLNKLESTLTELQLWSSEAPSPEQLNSHQPFAMDTLSFEQWLQFIFIPKMKLLIDNKIPLPESLQLLPYAEEVYKGKAVDHLLAVIAEIDCLFHS